MIRQPHHFREAFDMLKSACGRMSSCLLLAMLLLVSACDISPNDPNCIGKLKEDGPAWIEKTVTVDAKTGPVKGDFSNDPAEGWVPANLTVQEGEKIGFYVSNQVNLCTEGKTFTFSPDELNSPTHQTLVPYSENWAGEKNEDFAYRAVPGNFVQKNGVLIDGSKFENGWYNTGITISGSSTLSFIVSGQYSSYFNLAGVYPNFGWAKRANTESGNRTLSNSSEDAADLFYDTIANDVQMALNSSDPATELGNYTYTVTMAQYNEYQGLSSADEKETFQKEIIDNYFDQTEVGQLSKEYEQALLNFQESINNGIYDFTLYEEASRIQEEILEATGVIGGGGGLTAVGGRGLFVYIGQSAPAKDWFGGATDPNDPDTSSQDGNGDDFFELYSHENGTAGYYAFPPEGENTIFLRYAEDYFNRPGNEAHTYKCNSPQKQGLINNDECTWFFGRDRTPQKVPPKGDEWVWSNGETAGLNSYTNNSGGYSVSLSYHCVGSHGKYLDAKIIDPEGKSVYFGEPIATRSYIENELLKPEKGFWGDAGNVKPDLEMPVVPATGSLYFRVVDEEGRGDGDGDYNNNSGNYEINVGTYVYPNSISAPSHLIYNYIILPLRKVFFGTEEDDGVVVKMYEKITGESGYGVGLLVGIVRAMLVLYITLYAIQFIFGFIQDTRRDFFIRVLKVAIILQLIHPNSWEFFHTYLFRAFIDGSVDLIDSFTRHFSINAMTVGSGVEMHENDPFGFFNLTFGLLGNGFFWKKINALFMSPLSGWIYLVFIFACIWFFFLGVILAVYTYLMCMIALAFLISLAPIFLTMSLFEKTRTSFDNWLRQLANYTMQPVLMLIALAIFNLFIYSVFYRIASIPICKTCILSFDMGLVVSALPKLCFISDHTLWAGDPTDATGLKAYAVTYFTVLVFITIATCMNSIIDNATSLSASIFGGTPSGALTGKEAGLPGAKTFSAPALYMKNKSLALANKAVARAGGTKAAGLGFDRRAEHYQKEAAKFGKGVSDAYSNAKAARKTAKNALKRGGDWSKLASKVGAATRIPGASAVFGAAGRVAGLAVGTTEIALRTAREAARQSLNIVGSGLFEKDVKVGDTLSGGLDSLSAAAKHAKAEKEQEKEATGRAEEDT